MNEYGRHKVAGEMLVRSLGDRGFIARMSNVYGRYRLGTQEFQKGNVLTLFVQQAQTGVIRVHEPGNQVRDFVHVEDVVRFWQAAAEKLGRPPAPPPVLHFASGEMWSIRAVAEEVQRAAPNHPKIEMVPNPRVESLEPEFAIDTRRTRAWLGLEPTRTVRQTLHEEIQRGPQR
jgi:nucleoside-diphosphate-sugar epimerase